jgi:16S rRNA (adenine1518-N6/adenine1519-N6)-dimethyltransferase
VSLPPLREVVAKHGLEARKSLGQNFLFDLNLTAKIARVGGPYDGTSVLEIGPGPGGLTRGLIEAGAARIVAVERDRRCLAALGEIAEAYPGRLVVVEGDALDFDPLTRIDGPIKIVANLPYNIATPLLVRWLHAVHESPGRIAGMTLMFQKEVAARLVARPATSAYGRLSVLAQWLSEAKALFDIPPAAFVPPPKVVSTVVGFRPRPEPAAEAALDALERVVATAFNQRRKMLRSALRPLGDANGLLASAGIEPTRRAETLTVEEFCALARVFSAAARS